MYPILVIRETVLSSTSNCAIRAFHIVKELLIAAQADVVVQSVREPHGPTQQLNLKLEPWPIPPPHYPNRNTVRKMVTQNPRRFNTILTCAFASDMFYYQS